MIVFEKPGSFVSSALAAQLRAAGVSCRGVTCTEDDTGSVVAVQIICDDGTDPAAVEAAVNAYTPPPPTSAPGPSVQDKVAAALEQIQLGDGTQPVTADQLTQVIQALTG